MLRDKRQNSNQLYVVSNLSKLTVGWKTFFITEEDANDSGWHI